MNWQPIVTCESCGHKQQLERRLSIAEAFYVVCHECEAVLRVQLTSAEIARALAARKVHA